MARNSVSLAIALIVGQALACPGVSTCQLDAVQDIPELPQTQLIRQTIPTGPSQNDRISQDKHRMVAEIAVAEAERLRSLGEAGSSQKAIKSYEEALRLWKAIGERENEGATLQAIGEVQQTLGESKKALAYYQRALVLSQKAGLRPLMGQVLSNMGYAYTHTGDLKKALEYCTNALKINEDVGSVRDRARGLNNLGEVQYALGAKDKAMDLYLRALALWNDLRDPRGRAQTLLFIGYVQSDFSLSEKAFESYNQALTLSRSINDGRGKGETLCAIAHLHSKLGDTQRALTLYDEAMPLIEAAGDRIWHASTLIGVGYIHESLGDYSRSLDRYGKALLIFQRMNSAKYAASVLLNLGRVHHLMKDYREALSDFLRALALMRSINDRTFESYALRSLGAAHYSLGNSNKAIDYYFKALALFRAEKNLRGEALTLNDIGRVFAVKGEKVKALSCQTQALALNREVRDRFGEVSTLFSIARVERDSGQLEDARAHIEDATNKIELLRTNVANQELRASFMATVREYYDLSVDLLMRLHARNPAQGLDGLALHTGERARARSLMEMLTEARADIRQGVDATLLERERALQQSLTAKEELYSRLLTGKHTQDQSAAAAAEIESIRTEYQEVKALIRATSPRYAALTQPQPLSLKEIQDQVLDPDTLLLEYALGDDRSYLWAVTSDSLTSFELPKRADIEAAARRVYALLTEKNQIVTGETTARRKPERVARADSDYSKAAAALSQMVIGPVASQLGTKRLLIVADGALQYIPFGALPVPSAKGMAGGPLAFNRQENDQAPAPRFQPLIVEHEIVSLPSASILAVMRRELAGRKPAPKAVAVLADPVFSRLDPRVNSSRVTVSRQRDAVSMPRDFERAIKEVRVSRKRGGVGRLPFSRDEAAAIKKAAPAGQAMEAVGFDASRATATSDELSQYRIIHFATHGLLNSEHPELSGMVFSLVDRQGKDQHGFLRLHEVYNLNLPAELVVLSACQTGLGKDVKGEGLVGLTRGFMYAGAARVVASLWQVDDSATAKLMERFYAKMLGDGLRPAAALRHAQVEMWKQKRWQQPYYWAGFMLQGEWK